MEGMGVEERQSLDAGNVGLAQRLRRRREEIQRALSHACGVEGPGPVRDPEHSTQVDATFGAVTDYNLDCIERGGEVPGPIPPAALDHARLAVRNGLAFDDFLVGVIAAQTLLNEFVLQESQGLTRACLSEVQMLQGSILLRFASELAEEYKREESRLRQSASRRQSILVERLLEGAPVPEHEIGYALEMWHVGLVVSGTHAGTETRVLAERLGATLLTVPRETGTIWAWLGSHRKIPSRLVQEVLKKTPKVKAMFAVGEPGQNVEGWRSTHFEAKAALAVAIRRPTRVTCFSQVALEAMALQTPSLARSLQTAYLAPLAGDRRKGSTLRQTLRAYFASGRNASSAAMSLSVSRRTVENRLRIVEEALDRPLTLCGANLELALRLEDLDPELTEASPG